MIGGHYVLLMLISCQQRQLCQIQSEHNSYYSSSSPQKSRNIFVTAYQISIKFELRHLCKKVFLKFNGVIVGAILGVSNVWVAGKQAAAGWRSFA